MIGLVPVHAHFISFIGGVSAGVVSFIRSLPLLIAPSHRANPSRASEIARSTQLVPSLTAP